MSSNTYERSQISLYLAPLGLFILPAALERASVTPTPWEKLQ